FLTQNVAIDRQDRVYIADAGNGRIRRVFSTTSGSPVITSADTASGAVGQAFSYQITAYQGPTSFGASGLPAGLSVNSSSGLLSGTPTASGTFSIGLNATNASGTGARGLLL